MFTIKIVISQLSCPLIINFLLIQQKHFAFHYPNVPSQGLGYGAIIRICLPLASSKGRAPQLFAFGLFFSWL